MQVNRDFSSVGGAAVNEKRADQVIGPYGIPFRWFKMIHMIEGRAATVCGPYGIYNFKFPHMSVSLHLLRRGDAQDLKAVLQDAADGVGQL